MDRVKNEILGNNFIVPTDKSGNSKFKARSEEEIGNKIDYDVRRQRQIEYESDRGYHEIAKKIVEISGQYLKNQGENKAPLRNTFVSFFKWLLGGQFLLLIIFLFLNSIKTIPFEMSEYLLTTYIASVFVETLSLIGVMIAFSFTSKEESNIVHILTTVIQNYQKYDSNNKSGSQNSDN